jgi:hypothetical protein
MLAMLNIPGCTLPTINSAANTNPTPAQMLVGEFITPLQSRTMRFRFFAGAI